MFFHLDSKDIEFFLIFQKIQEQIPNLRKYKMLQ